MNERMNGILNRIKEFWNKYNKKQKTVIITSVILALLLIVLVSWYISQPKWELLVKCNNYTEVSEVEALLEENGIAYELGDDAMSISVNKKDLKNAKVILGSNDIKATGYSIEDALNGSFSTTEKDKSRKYEAYLESQIAGELEALDMIRSANVNITIPESTSVILSSQEDTSVAVILTLKGTVEDIDGEGLAQYLKTAVGNKSTEKVTIIASTGATIYSGESSSSATLGGSLVTQQKYAQQINDTIRGGIRNTLLKLPMYDDAQVTLNLDIDFDEVQEITHLYEAQEGREEGLYKESYEEVSTGSTGVGGVPGTESNDDETTYLIQNGDGSVSEYKVNKYSYYPNEFVTTTNKRPGDIIKESSSVAVVLHNNIVYTYEEVKAAGHLKEMTWEEFKVTNGQYEATEVDEEIRNMIAHGAGIPSENVTVLAYNVPYFVDAEEAESTSSFWIRVALIGAIVLLLAFVVFRSARPVAVKETEPELSVEDMLASTRESQVNAAEEIELQDKSEIRIAIEKFVDENPEAVALLLRNWLDDDWE